MTEQSHHTRFRMSTARTALLCAALFTVIASTPATGQPAAPDDVRWLPWMGCWQLTEETGVLPEDADERRAFANRVVVCVSPSAAADGAPAVDVATFADGEQILVETLRADAVDHAVTETSCSGHRRDTWSADGTRLFTRAELACGDGGQRSVSGVGLMVAPTTWLDIQLVETEGRGAVTVRRYLRAGQLAAAEAGAALRAPELREQALDAARVASSSRLDSTDVIEAHRETEPAVVEAMLVETGERFALDRRALLELDDAGVPANLVDLMVALSFPEQFVVGRSTAQAFSSSGVGGIVGGSFGGFADTYSPYGLTNFSQWYPYYASPFGYYYGWSAYDSLYLLGPAYSYGLRYGDFQLGGGEIQEQGRAYNGRGYSRIAERAPAEPRGAGPRSGTGSSGTSRGVTSGGGGGGNVTSGTGVSPGGYTGGGRTGRTAQPR